MTECIATKEYLHCYDFVVVKLKLKSKYNSFLKYFVSDKIRNIKINLIEVIKVF